MIGSSLEDLIHSKNLSLCSFGLELSAEMVPELSLGYNFVASEESDGIDFGVRVFFGGRFASKDEILSDLNARKRNTFIWREGSLGSCAPFDANLTIKEY